MLQDEVCTMIESVSTSWVYGANLNPVNESSDCAQVKTSESAQRLARHEEPQKHGLLMRLLITVANFFGFNIGTIGVGDGGRNSGTSSPADNDVSKLHYSAESLRQAFELLYDMTCSKVAKAQKQSESMSLEGFIENYHELLNADNFIRNVTALPADLVKFGGLRSELAPLAVVGANLNKIEILEGFSFANCYTSENRMKMQEDPQAAAKVYGAMQFLVEQFIGLPNPSETDASKVVSFVEQIEANFKAHVEVAPLEIPADQVMVFAEPFMKDTQVFEEEVSDSQRSSSQRTVALLKEVKLQFVNVSDIGLPSRSDFYATMNSLQRPMSPLSQSFEQLERLAEQGSAAETAIASMVLDHTAVGQSHSYGDLFGERKMEANLLQAHSALSFVDTLQKKLDMAARLLGNLQAADAA
jgi:hypothetical protein